jgi:hypothetical protein
MMEEEIICVPTLQEQMMANEEERATIATEILLDLTEAIAEKDKEKFVEIFNNRRTQLHHCIDRISYLQSKALSVYESAIEKFIK